MICKGLNFSMSVRIILHSFDSPEMNLSAEEYFFLQKNQHQEDILRIWESDVFFVVIGSSQSVLEEVYIDKCISRGIKILRRCSAGGAVLQGPGCINYSLYLNLENYPHLRNIRASYQFILASLSKTLKEIWQLDTSIEGISDLCFNNRKVSGNAQRRNSKVLLHHGTLLYDVNYDILEEVLQNPRIQPEYRARRTHRDFVGILPLSREEIIDCVIRTFALDGFFSSITEKEMDGIRELAEEKYSRKEWNFKR